MRIFLTGCQLFLVLFLSGTMASAQMIEPKLIGGTPVDTADWPASPWIGNCSSTLIGERVLLTAAHCVRNGASKSFTIDGIRYSGTCSHHPSYVRNNTADYALCLLKSPVPKIEFETLATKDEVACAQGRQFLWTGYGCRKWGGGIDGQFRVGTVDALRCPMGLNNDIITTGSVALCSGDSGGGGYIEIGASRKLVGVNSRSNTTDTSYVSSTSTSAFVNWAKSWSQSKSVKICGIHSDATRCSY
jgi:hypothetical protein